MTVRPPCYAYATYQLGENMIPVSANGVSIGYINYFPSLPWEVWNVEVGEIWGFATYREARAFAKAR